MRMVLRTIRRSHRSSLSYVDSWKYVYFKINNIFSLIFYYMHNLHHLSICTRFKGAGEKSRTTNPSWIFPSRIQPIVKQYRRRCHGVFMLDSRAAPIPVIGECLQLKYADTNTSICLLRSIVHEGIRVYCRSNRRPRVFLRYVSEHITDNITEPDNEISFASR